MYQEQHIQRLTEELGKWLNGKESVQINGQAVIYITPQEFDDLRLAYPPQVYTPLQRAASELKNASSMRVIFVHNNRLVCDSRAKKDAA